MTDQSQELFRKLNRVEKKLDNVLAAIIFGMCFYVFTTIWDAAMKGYGNRWVAYGIAFGIMAIAYYVLREVFGVGKSN
jgi:hypothetical protein